MVKNFDEISSKDIGTKITLLGKVEFIKQTSGPTLFVLNDGTKNFTLKAFVGAGIRAYPEISVGDIMKVYAGINKRNGDIEGEIFSLKEVTKKDSLNFLAKLNTIQEKQLHLECNEFSIKSKALESLKPRFIKVAKIIKKAIIEGRPILLRHNADCDGYSSGITIERAILGFMEDYYGENKQIQFQNYRRAPSKAPFYEYEDSVKDISNWLRDKNRNDAKEPLIIITDNGSTEEDILSMKQMLIYGAEIIVIDHHFPGEIIDGKVKVDQYVKGHINPYLTGYDSNICAGILGYELARFIYKNNKNSVFIPAMAGLLDHAEGPEVEQYLEQAKKKGFTEEYLRNLGEIIDMESHYFKFMESREFFNDLFGNNKEMQEKVVEMLIPELKKRYSSLGKVAEFYAEKIDYKNFYFIKFNGEKGTYRGEYPAIGKTTNYIHQLFENKQDKPIITMTYGTTFLTIRVSDKIKFFSVPDFVKIVEEKLPQSYANGGGHEHAGSVRFIEYAKDDILDLFTNYLLEIDKQN